MPPEPADPEFPRRLDAAGAALDEPTRLLAIAIAAIGPARWSLFDAACARLQAIDAPRTDLDETLLQATLFFGD